MSPVRLMAGAHQMEVEASTAGGLSPLWPGLWWQQQEAWTGTTQRGAG